MAGVQSLDPDVLVGHNITGSDLPILLERMKEHSTPRWSRVGRLIRHAWPAKGFTGAANNASAGASPEVLTCTAGRLLCDTHTSGEGRAAGAGGMATGRAGVTSRASGHQAVPVWRALFCVNALCPCTPNSPPNLIHLGPKIAPPVHCLGKGMGKAG